jgi:hypothetical protein
MKIKILKCSNAMLWYNKHVGEEFEVRFVDDKAYWTRERDGIFNALNWVYKEDATITEGNTN